MYAKYSLYLVYKSIYKGLTKSHALPIKSHKSNDFYKISYHVLFVEKRIISLVYIVDFKNKDSRSSAQ